MSVIGPVQLLWGSPVGKRNLRWKGRFWAWSERVKEWWMTRVGMTEMSWEVDEEVNQDKNGEADGINLEVDSRDEVMHI